MATALPKLPSLPGLPTPGKGTGKVRKSKYEHGQVGKKSKSKDPACSQAMSEWKTSGSTPQIQAVLGKCRAKTHAMKQAELHRSAGNEAKAQVLLNRAATGKVGVENRKQLARDAVAQRAAKQLSRHIRHQEQGKAQQTAPPPAGKPIVAKATGRGTDERAALADKFRAQRHLERSGVVPSHIQERMTRFDKEVGAGRSEELGRQVFNRFGRSRADRGLPPRGAVTTGSSTGKTTTTAPTDHGAAAIAAGRQQAADIARHREAMAKPTRTFKLKPQSETQRKASEAVGSVLAAKRNYNQLRQETDDPARLDVARAVIAQRDRAAQPVVKAARKELKREKLLATPQSKRSSEEFTGHAGPTRVETPKVKAPVAAPKVAEPPKPAPHATPPPAPLTPHEAHKRYHELRHRQGEPGFDKNELAAARKAMDEAKAKQLADVRASLAADRAKKAEAAKPTPAPPSVPSDIMARAQARSARLGRLGASDDASKGQLAYERVKAAQAAREAHKAKVAAPKATEAPKPAVAPAAPSTVSAPTHGPGTPAEHVERVKHAFEEADAADRGKNFVKIHEIRKRLPDLSREQQDAAIRQLRLDRHLTGSSHEGLHGKITPEEKASGIKDHASHLIYLERGEHYTPPKASGAAAVAPPKAPSAPAKSVVERAREVKTAAESRASSAPHGDLHHRIYEHMEVIQPQARYGAVVSMKELRESPKFAGVPHDALEGAVRRLADEGKVGLHQVNREVNRGASAQGTIVGFGRRETELHPDLARHRQANAASAAPKPDVHGDLPTFAARVKSVAAGVGPEGRFGDNKVYISHVHSAYEKIHGSIPVHEFKSKLGQAVQARHIDLSRADMVEAMHAPTVKASETMHPAGGAEFHFIRSEPTSHAAVAAAPKPTVSAPASAPVGSHPPDTHAKVQGGLAKIFRGESIDDRGMTISQIAKHSGVSEEHAASYLHSAAKKGIVEYDHFNEHDARVAGQFGKVHTDPTTGKPIAAVRIMRPKRLHELA